MEPVGVGLRAVAVIIDSVLLIFIGYFIGSLTGQNLGGGMNLSGGPALLFFLIGFAYYTVMEVTMGGTLGKKAMGLKVVTVGGAPISWQAGIVRNLLRIIDGFFFYLVGAIVVWVSKSKQRLGDMAAKTLVVRKGAAAEG